jgi:hypothetical protein
MPSIGEVDEYPSFVDCDKLDNKSARQQCFFEFNPAHKES